MAEQWKIDKEVAREALGTALCDLSDAVRDAMKAGSDTTMHPDLDRQALRDMSETAERLVKENCDFGHDG